MSDKITITITREELVKIIKKECPVYLHHTYERLADAILSAGSQEKWEISFDKEKTLTLNELVNGTGIK